MKEIIHRKLWEKKNRPRNVQQYFLRINDKNLRNSYLNIEEVNDSWWSSRLPKEIWLLPHQASVFYFVLQNSQFPYNISIIHIPQLLLISMSVKYLSLFHTWTILSPLTIIFELNHYIQGRLVTSQHSLITHYDFRPLQLDPTYLKPVLQFFSLAKPLLLQLFADIHFGSSESAAAYSGINAKITAKTSGWRIKLKHNSNNKSADNSWNE